MGRMENKPSKDKSSYFVTDNNIADSTPHIPTVMATPLVETSSFTNILSPSVKDQINSFVSSDSENDYNNLLETLEVIDNAYKYVKYKKMIRKEKHQEYLLKTGCKSPSLENTKNNENTKQFSDPQARKENTDETAEANKEFHWLSGTFAIVGDSMIYGIDEKQLQKHGNANIFFTFRVQELII